MTNRGHTLIKVALKKKGERGSLGLVSKGCLHGGRTEDPRRRNNFSFGLHAKISVKALPSGGGKQDEIVSL